eukprot:1638744-Lingulodinium_polyedra.AAC.1
MSNNCTKPRPTARAAAGRKPAFQPAAGGTAQKRPTASPAPNPDALGRVRVGRRIGHANNQ